MSKNDNVVVLVPSYQPDEKLLKYVNELINHNFDKILIINDGSDIKCNTIYEKLKEKKQCIVIEHEKNKGKGYALKTGFEYYLNNIDKKIYNGIVTADSDGQHSVIDTIKIAESIIDNKDSINLILGVRNFNENNIPFRSKFGNKLTSRLFKLLYGAKIQDSQTGLRGFTNKIIKDCISIKGDRYEYETNQLIYCINKCIPIKQIEISTIYIEDNKTSHFNPIKDSFKIYLLVFESFIKFSISGIIAFLIDYILFYILHNFIFYDYKLGISILLSTIIARIISSVINFTFNKTIVFNAFKQESNFKLLVKYYSLCICQMIVSAEVVTRLSNLLNTSANIVKILVDITLFFISYRIQRKFIFKQKKGE